MKTLKLAATLLAAGAANVFAQPDGAAAAPEASKSWIDNLSFSLYGGAEVGFDGDLDDSEGTMSVTRVGAALGLNAPIGERVRVFLSLTEDFLFYDFDNEVAIAGSNEPIDDAAVTSIGLRANIKLDDQWTLLTGALAGWAAETGADWQSSLTPSGLVGATHRFNDRLTVGGGVLVSQPIEDDLRLSPIVIVDWMISSRVQVSTVPSASGVSLRLTYSPWETWSFFAQGGADWRDIRLSDDSDAPIPDGVFRESRYPVAVGAMWRPNGQVSIGARVGMALAGKIEFDDEDGDEVFDDEVGGAPFFGIEASLRF